MLLTIQKCYIINVADSTAYHSHFASAIECTLYKEFQAYLAHDLLFDLFGD